MAAMIPDFTYPMLAIGIISLIAGFLLRSRGKPTGLALALVGVLFIVSPILSLLLGAFGGADKLGASTGVFATNAIGAVVIIAGIAAGAYAVKRRRTMSA